MPLVKFSINEEDILKFGIVKTSHQWLLLLCEYFFSEKKKEISSTLHWSLLIIILVYEIEAFKRACIINKTCLKTGYA